MILNFIGETKFSDSAISGLINRVSINYYSRLLKRVLATDVAHSYYRGCNSSKRHGEKVYFYKKDSYNEREGLVLILKIISSFSIQKFSTISFKNSYYLN